MKLGQFMRVRLVAVVVIFLQGYFISCYDLTLLHVNDIHVRMEETSKYSSTCKQADKVAGRHAEDYHAKFPCQYC